MNKKKVVRVSALINGAIIALPDEANWIMQDVRGIYYWLDQRATIVLKDKSDQPYDWTPRKNVIQYKSHEGYDRALMGQPPEDWTKTLQRTVRSSSLPKNR